MSLTEAGLVCEELGAALHPGPWLSSSVVAPRALRRFGADNERARELFTGIADGSVIAAVGVHTSFAADQVKGGTTLRGEIADVQDAGAADVLLAVGGGAELYAVPLSLPEVRIDEIAGTDKSSKNFRVTFAGAGADLIAVADDLAVEALIDDMIVAWAADALGAARQILQMTVEYAKVRRQFGAPIGSFQAVAHLCVDMHETVDLARSGVLYALWAADFADRAERHRAALRVKAFAGRLATVGDLAIQVFGGIGFTWEHNAHLYLKRLLTFSRYLGSPGDYLEQVGRELAGSTT
jgi:alkylation response protein AidB-like acyl-CoA dehydrogenase